MVVGVGDGDGEGGRPQCRVCQHVAAEAVVTEVGRRMKVWEDVRRWNWVGEGVVREINMDQLLKFDGMVPVREL